MSDSNVKELIELLKLPGNSNCNDCGAENPEWASHNIGVFLCTICAGIHRKIGAHISKVKSLKLDKWTVDQIQVMRTKGNIRAKEHYERHIPLCYKIPTRDAGCRDICQVLLEQWIRAKYEREEFIYEDKQIYKHGYIELYLWKRGKLDDRFKNRKFILNEKSDTLTYFVNEKKEPKAVIKISELNATFVPYKMGHPNGLQISYVKDGSTRHIFVYANDGKEIVDFYLAIRAAKLMRLQVAFPGTDDSELAARLTKDFLKEGYLWKTGPRSSDGYKKRWFTLDDRKLMYMEGPLAAYAKGEIFIGHRSNGYSVLQGVSPGSRDHAFAFTLKTPNRSYIFSAETYDERSEWISVLENVIMRPVTPQEISLSALLVRKKPSTITLLSIF